jgi:hypothetical protein
MNSSGSLSELEHLVLWALEALTSVLIPLDGVVRCLDPEQTGLFGTSTTKRDWQPSLLAQLRSDLSGKLRVHFITEEDQLEKNVPGATDGCLTIHALDSAFADATSCKTLLQSVARSLRPGGRFFGICVDSASAWTPIQKHFESRQTSGSVSKAWLETSLRSGGRIQFRVDETPYAYARTAYGHEFRLEGDSGIESAHRSGCLVNFAELIRIAPQCGLVFREALNLRNLWDEFHRPLQYCEEMRSFYHRLPGQQFRPSIAALDSAIYFSTFVLEAVEKEDAS